MIKVGGKEMLSGSVGSIGIGKDILKIFSGSALVWEKSVPPMGASIQVTLSGVPTSIAFAPLKYNKNRCLSMDWDDGTPSALDAMADFNNRSYDDGTGSQVNWRGGAAVIGKSTFNDAELASNPEFNSLLYADMEALIASGWDIMNHGMYSAFDGNYHYDTAQEDLDGLTQLILDRISYRMNSTVVPANYNGYTAASKASEYLGSTSQNGSTADGEDPIPQADWAPLADISSLPAGFKFLIRQFTDSWDPSGLSGKIDDLINNSTGGVRKLLRIGTHDSGKTGFVPVMDDIDTRSAGDIWVCSMREMLEYFTIRDQGAISYNGGVISLTIPDGLRWEDVTLLVDGAEVTSATSSYFDKVTFSGGMINAYKEAI